MEAILAIVVLVVVLYFAMDTSDEQLYGKPNSSLVCPHCRVAGQVHTKSVKRKAGVSGGKATAALLTGGISLLAVGLSRKQDMTEAHCCNCDSTWTF